ncbi:SUKH-4 family immunity protein [Kitasatospora sp. KL5]|uniref:SUKH-4 family immunity protein n=1 Tax=Kitasatospora sp. KL5 TaxID=3425125 RepID=UPI003D6F7157
MLFEPAARDAAARELLAWLERRDPADRIRLVTGGGPAGRQLLARVAGEAAGTVDGAADATGLTAAQWAHALAGELGAADALRHGEDVWGFTAGLAEADRPLAVVLTGTPGMLRAAVADRAPELLYALLDQGWSGGAHRTRVLAEVGREALADLLRRRPALADSVVDLDAERFAPAVGELEAGLCGLLDKPDAVAVDDPSGAAAAIAKAAAGSDALLAEVLAAAVRLRGRADPVLPGTLPGAWEYFLASVPGAESARHLLAPLLLAEGLPGMPDDLRLEAAAELSGHRFGAEELARAEECLGTLAAAGPVPAGHARLRDAALAEAALAAYGTEAAEVQRRIAVAVCRRLPQDLAGVAAGRPLTPAEEYALRFGVAHALGGGLLDEWLADPLVLALGDPRTLAEAVAAAPRTADAGARRRRGAVAEAVRMYRQDQSCGTAEWVSRLRFAALMWGDVELVAVLDGLGLVLPWRAEWVRWRPLGVFDTREFAPGWTGPVDVVGWGRGPGETSGGSVDRVCVYSPYDWQYRWYALADGRQLGGALSGQPAADTEPTGTGGSSGRTVEVLEDFDLLKVRVDGPGLPDGGTVHTLCASRYPRVRAYPLPGGRVLLAGHSGAALISLAPTGPAPGLPPAATDPRLLPPPHWWAGNGVDAEELRRYYHHGVVRGDHGRLVAAGVPDGTARVLSETGLPGYPVFGQQIAECLDDLRTLADHQEEQGEPAEEDQQGYTVIGLCADDVVPLCVEHTTGRIMYAEGGEPDLLNTSAAAFAACQALTSWALCVSATRDGGERAEFLGFLRAALTRIDPEAAADQGAGWWWFETVEDGSMYSLAP